MVDSKQLETLPKAGAYPPDAAAPISSSTDSLGDLQYGHDPSQNTRAALQSYRRALFLVFRRADSQLREVFHVASRLPDRHGKEAVDMGCGTGAFTKALKSEGWDVGGIDVAEAMVRGQAGSGVLPPLSIGDAIAGLEFPDKSVDLVSAAYVAHGLVRADKNSAV